MLRLPGPRWLSQRGHCDKTITDWVAQTTDIFFPMVLEAGNPNPRCWQIWPLVRAHFRLTEGHPLCVPTQQRGSKFCGISSSSSEGTSTILRASPS